MVELGLLQREVAEVLGIHEATLSRYLKQGRPMPEGFEAKVQAAVELLHRAAAAAEEARARVLAEWEGEATAP